MMKLFYFCLFLFISLHLSAQADRLDYSLDHDKFVIQQLTGEKYLDLGTRNIGIFFKNHWNKGRVILSSGDSVDNLMLRYDGLLDRLIWLNEKTGQIKLDTACFSEFIFFDTIQYHFKKIYPSDPEKSKSILCQVLIERKLKLYVKRNVKPFSEFYDKMTKYFVYKPHPVYYLFIKNKSYIIASLSIRSIYKCFPEKKEILKQRVRQKHLKIRKESDLINLFYSIEDILCEPE